MEISIISVITLILLEIILSIDNLIFVVTISERMSGRFKKPVKFFGLTIALFLRAVFLVRVVGLSMAFFMRGVFVFSMDSIFKMKTTFFKIGSQDITYKELIFILGGLLLIYKSGMEAKRIVLCSDEDRDRKIEEAKLKDSEIADKNSTSDNEKNKAITRSDFIAFFIAIFQIILVDLVFSIDSVLIAIALVPDVRIIMLAVFISMVTLFFSLDALSKIMKKYQNLKLLAMLFIIGIGLLFIFKGFGLDINKNYLNASFIFSLIFTIFDIIRRKNRAKRNLD